MSSFRQFEHHEVKNKVSEKEIILFIEPISSPANIGGIFRIAEAMGVKKIYWKDQKFDLLGKKITKIARSTNKTVSFETTEGYEILDKFKGENYHIIGLELTTEAENIHLTKFPKRIVMIIGSEKEGVSSEALRYCDTTCFIPMHGNNTSINLVVALGIGLSVIVK